jgi:hypothetical protein
MCLQMDAHEAVKPWQVAKPCTPGCETSASGGESRENLAPQVAKKNIWICATVDLNDSNDKT